MRVILATALLASGTAVPAQERHILPHRGVEHFRPHYLPDAEGPPEGGAVKVTFLGTATLLFDDGETQVLTDGFFSRPSMLRVARGKLETDTRAVDAALKRAKIDRLKAVFVAHSHYDHAFDVAYVAKKTGAKVYGSASTLNVARGGDVPEEQMELFKPNKAVRVGKFTVTVLESKHSPPIRGINDDLGQTIDKPLRQPASARDYKEGGSFDFLIKCGDVTALVRPSASYVDGELDDVRADALFQGTATLGDQSYRSRRSFYEETVKKVRPKLVVPIHWDSFFHPLSDRLEAPAKLVDDVPAAFDFLIDRLRADKIKFGILQGYQSVMLPYTAPPEKRDK